MAQIIASVALPVALVAVGRNYLIMPAAIVTVGVQFVWLHQLLHVPRLGTLGVALILIPIATTVALSGNAQTTSVLVIAGTLMIATGTTAVRTLAAHAPAALHTQPKITSEIASLPRRVRVSENADR